MPGLVMRTPVTDPLDPLALFNDYIFNNSAGNSAGQSPFTITGLGDNATVDLYFYKRSGSITIEGVERGEFAVRTDLFNVQGKLYDGRVQTPISATRTGTAPVAAPLTRPALQRRPRGRGARQRAAPHARGRTPRR